MQLRRILFPILISVPSLATAQDGPSFDCARASTSAEELVCADAGLATLDRRVAEVFAQALVVIRELDAGAKAAEDRLRATQRGWIKGRDACWKASDQHACIEAAYLRREGSLVARWILMDPTGTSFWACDGNPANEVVTMFFDTPLPSVRFERGDSIDVGSLVPTGSGAKYEGSFGRSIWIKGDSAAYRDPDPDGTEMTCVLATPR